jgi:hypothetical protein
MRPTDDEVRVVIVLPREYRDWFTDRYWLTEKGEKALDAALRNEPTVPIPHAVAEEARDLARQHRTREMASDPPTLL